MPHNSYVQKAPSALPEAVQETTPVLHELQQTLSALVEKHSTLEQQNHQLHRMCKALEQARMLYEELYTHAPTGYAILSADGDIQNINCTGARILRQYHMNLIGTSFYSFLANSDKETFLYHLAQCREHHRHAITVRLAEEHTLAAAVTLHIVSVSAQEATSPDISFRTVLVETAHQHCNTTFPSSLPPTTSPLRTVRPLPPTSFSLARTELEQELEQKNKDLTMLALQCIEKQEQFAALEQQLKRASWVSPSQSRQLIQTMLHNVQASLRQQPSWHHTEQHFGKDTRTFFHTLAQQYPELTSAELKICNFIRLAMSTKEMASLLHTSPKTIENQRYRIRKKLGLSPKQNLTSFLIAL